MCKVKFTQNFKDAKSDCLNLGAKLALADPKDKKVYDFAKKIAEKMDISDFWVDNQLKNALGNKAFICEKDDKVE